ncbi:replication protein a-related [Anaeramoeba flamelloides]|uniref:Replication protein a-related n=1 Tax=Anaeramoeba flamelloides TaxID=1746091 RepID=A0AAV8AEN7_9EUKA|nr:replication protein a-related [Anaeramoeba flamelloides]
MSLDFESQTFYPPQNNFVDQTEKLQVFGQETVNSQSKNYDSRTTPYNSQTVTPVTIAQLLKAQQIYDDSFFLDGKRIFQINIIGILTKVEVSKTSIKCEITDGTGSISIKFYGSSFGGESQEKQLQKLQIGKYVRILGRMKTFSQERTINSSNIFPITNHNEITHHFLHVIKVHYHNLSLQQQQQQEQQNPYLSQEKNMNQNNMFQYQQQDQQQQFYQNQPSETVTNQNSQVFQEQQSQIQFEQEQQQAQNIYQKVHSIIKESNSIGGCGIEEIQNIIGLEESQLVQIINYWINQGGVTPGKDEKHWIANF